VHSVPLRVSAQSISLESEIKKMRLLLDVRIKNKLTSEQKSLLDKIRRRPSPRAR